MSLKVLTVICYGLDRNVEFLVAVVHKGKKFIATQVFQSRDYPSEEELVDDLLAFGWHHQIVQVRFVEDVLPPQEATCPDCGKIMTPLG